MTLRSGDGRLTVRPKTWLRTPTSSRSSSSHIATHLRQVSGCMSEVRRVLVQIQPVG